MNPIRVLLVDDNIAFLEAAKAYLQGLPGVEVVAIAASAAEGLARNAELRPDLAMIDVEMPGIDGFEAIRRLRQGPEVPRTVICSLHDADPYRARAKAAGADAFIAKSDLVATVPALIGALFPGWHA